MSKRVLFRLERIATTARVYKALIALLVLVLPASIVAQTVAHYSYVQQPSIVVASPSGVSLDTNGNVYVSTGARVLQYTPSNGSYNNTFTYIYPSPTSPVQALTSNATNIWVVQDGKISESDVNELGYSVANGSGLGSNVAAIARFSGSAIFGTILYIADTANNRIAYGSETITPQALFSVPAPMGVAAVQSTPKDAWGQIFVTTGNTLQKFVYGPSGNTYDFTSTLIASDLNAPQGVAADSAGNIYVADTGNNRIQKFTLSNGTYTESTVVSGLTAPTRLAVDDKGTIFVIQGGSIRIFTPGPVSFGSQNIGTTSAGKSLTFTFDASVTGVTATVLTEGVTDLDFADTNIGTCSTNGATHSYVSGDTCTVNVTFSPKFAGLRQGTVILKDSSGNLLAAANISGTGLGPQLSFLPATQNVLIGDVGVLTGIAVDGSGNIFLADPFNTTAVELTKASGYVGYKFRGSNIDGPTAIALDAAGNIYVGGNTSVYQIIAADNYSTIKTLASSFRGIYGLALDKAGNIFVADTNNNAVKEIVAAGGYTTVKTIATGIHATGITVDANDNVFVLDGGENSIVEYPASGGYATGQTVVTGLNYPFGLAVNQAGDLIVADLGSASVKQILAAGGYTTVNTLVSGLDQPQGVAVDGKGDVYVAEFDGRQVLKLTLSQPPAIDFGSIAVGTTSSATTVTVHNIGNAPLTLAVPASGNNPSVAQYFTLDDSASTACPVVTSSSEAATVEAGGSCTLSIAFAPTVDGSINGSVSLTDDELNVANSQQSVVVSGTGVLQVTSFTVVASSASAGTQVPVTVTAKDGSGNTLTSYTGTVHFSSTSASAVLPADYTFTAEDAGVKSFNVTFTSAGAPTLSVADMSITSATGSTTVSVAPGAASTITVVSGDGQSTPVYSAFTNPLVVKVVDAYGNNVPGVTVTFTAPMSGASATLTPSTVITTADGTASVTATANGVASNGSYAVAAMVGTTSANFSLTNTKASSSLVLTPSVTSTVYGKEDVTLTADVTSGGAGNPVTGAVTFLEDGTALPAGSSVTLTNKRATYAVSTPAVGTHNYAAQYTGSDNSLPSNVTNAANAVTVSKAASTLSVAASSGSFASGTGVSISVGVAGQYSGTGVATPTGSINSVFDNGTSQINGTAVAISGASASVAVPASLPAGNYTVTFSYSGDNNYTAAAAVHTSLTITQAQGTEVRLASSAGTYYYGQPLSLTVTVTNTSGTPDGSVSFYDGGTLLSTLTLANGTATYNASTLSVGTHSITAVYAGNNYYVGATSSVLSQVVLTPAVSINGSAVGGSIGNIALSQGGSATTTFQVGALGTINSSVSLACSGLPNGLTCQISPSTVSASSLPASVSVTVSSGKYQIIGRNLNSRGLASLGMVFGLVLPGIVVVRRNRKGILVALMLMLVLASLLGMVACGNGKSVTNAGNLTPAGNYTATITATSTGATPITSSLTVTVR